MNSLDNQTQFLEELRDRLHSEMVRDEITLASYPDDESKSPEQKTDAIRIRQSSEDRSKEVLRLNILIDNTKRKDPAADMRNQAPSIHPITPAMQKNLEVIIARVRKAEEREPTQFWKTFYDACLLADLSGSEAVHVLGYALFDGSKQAFGWFSEHIKPKQQTITIDEIKSLWFQHYVQPNWKNSKITVLLSLWFAQGLTVKEFNDRFTAAAIEAEVDLGLPSPPRSGAISLTEIYMGKLPPSVQRSLSKRDPKDWPARL